ncbi:esterase family protein [Virgibacillus sp. NKC19-16]|uniref:alpha/beta hydrolase n=1 Tax=Virgibacillus salidurans TaxID=2831673 RepID=UPI001EECDA30|nr:alpha/beta hydrolase-fold protein [Virgibacillus sp. NKC19-16]UJL45772.1 esterase family protein [Virgibacillus sp. NKC19-16]
MNLIKKEFHSEIQNRNYTYYLLTSAETVEDAYVLYVQDGKDYLELGGFEETFQKLIETDSNLASKIVFVLIHPGDSMERWQAYHRQGNQFENYMQFMTDEFIPTVEKELNRNIVKRGLLGDSLAGNSSLNLAMRNPEQWTHLLLQSAAIAIEDIGALSKMDKLDWNIYQTVGRFEDEFISVITNEKLYILTRNRELHETFILKRAKIEYTEQEASHEWVFWKKDLVNALNYFMTTP